jgi:hypothetical protein
VNEKKKKNSENLKPKKIKQEEYQVPLCAGRTSEALGGKKGHRVVRE